MLSFTTNEILAVAIAASFAAGLNVYATVATLGVLSHVQAFQLPPALHILGSWPVIIVCAILFGLEFFADKIPIFDLIWNALNTFVKVPVATLLSYGAAQHLSPGLQVAVAALGGAIALASHGSKLAVRTAVTPSPEPFSNMALSLGEDVAAISLTWFATRHPIIATGIVAICLVMAILAIRYLLRALRRLFRQARTVLQPTSAV
jgi:F0F1-type ATP synthase membrane subunit c/vacuolar-type H+-ATPase subunit K